MWSSILLVLWFFLPVGLANGTPVIIMHLPFFKKLNYPLDCYLKFKGIRIFGDHKSWRGLISGVLVGIITAVVQQNIYMNSPYLKETLSFDFSSVNPVIYGLLAGLGALLGDAIKSFFKRRMNLKPGASWIPFDQIDYILGGIIFLMPYIRLSVWDYILTFIVWLGLHLISTNLGFRLKLKDSPI